ncbi:alginate export family protein [Phytohalomonas tamaricis]|uniref:alginate export family protein n=1 Tax=Phytohalomonas tamaricis TaxID=2081032 RepID=UPI0021D40E90|nr:alginate export family protein [Phytohalomonas tamaricis]
MILRTGMHATACLLAVAAPFNTALAQALPQGEPGLDQVPQARPIRPGPPRYLENYPFLADSDKQTDFFDPIRHIKLGESSWLQLGGGVRYKYEHLDNPGFGLSGESNDHYLQQRLQAHADFHLFDDALRAFIQLEDTESWGKDIYSPTDQSDAEIHQAFVGVRLPTFGHGSLVARLGRQEMAFGEEVLVTVREVPNVRQTFDGVRLSYNAGNGYKLDAWAMRPVTNLRTGSFNDSSDDDSGDFYGLYGTLPVNKMLNVDLYGMSYLRDERILNGVSGKEDRYTLGTRLHGQNKQGVDYSANLIYQFGKFAGDDIRAWGLWSAVGYTLESAQWKPGMALRFDVASGDDNPNDNESNTFDPLFPANGKFYGNASLTTMANLIAIGPQFAFSPHPDVTISPTILALWRESSDDAAYMPNMRPIAGTADVSGRRLGTSYDLFTRWTPTANLTVDLEYQYYDVSDVIRDVGGKDTQYLSLRTSFLF